MFKVHMHLFWDMPLNKHFLWPELTANLSHLGQEIPFCSTFLEFMWKRHDTRKRHEVWECSQNLLCLIHNFTCSQDSSYFLIRGITLVLISEARVGDQ